MYHLSIFHDISPFSWINYKNSSFFFETSPSTYHHKVRRSYSRVVRFTSGNINRKNLQKSNSRSLLAGESPLVYPILCPWNQRGKPTFAGENSSSWWNAEAFVASPGLSQPSSPKKSPLSRLGLTAQDLGHYVYVNFGDITGNRWVCLKIVYIPNEIAI